MAAKTEAGYIDGYVSDDGKIGLEVHGEEAVKLNAPFVYLSDDTPLLTTAQDLAGAINELFQGGSGGGDLKGIIDDGLSSLSVILTDNAETPTLSEYGYTYAAKNLSQTITTQSSNTSADGTVTTVTKSQSFSKMLIDKLYNASGRLILQAVYSDAAKGIADHYLDADGNKISIDGRYLNE